MAVSWQRVQDLVKKRAQLFNTAYNPLNIRTGASALRRPLKGPAVAAYYPPRIVSFKAIAKRFGAGYEGVDDVESERLDHIAIMKARGKGAPKKKRTKEESKKAGKRRPAVPKPPPPT